MNDWKQTIVSPQTSLRDTIACIDRSTFQVALVQNNENMLVGIVTDGDIRRAILRGLDLSIEIKEVMNANPKTAHESATSEELLRLMKKEALHHLPLVNDDGFLVSLITLDELVGSIEKSNPVVIMAGGLGRRLYPLTEKTPKPMLLVGGKPILETILESLVSAGFNKFYIAVNFKAEKIKDHFGDGTKWGIDIEYIHENIRLGTAGALSLLPDLPSEPIIVMNGDILTNVSYDGLLQFHNQNRAVATMAVRKYDFEVPYGVVNLEGSTIKGIEEKPVQNFFVNAGIYVLSPEVLSHVPANEFYDMPTLFEKLIANDNKRVSAYPLREYWLDIGISDEFDKAQREWNNHLNSHD